MKVVTVGEAMLELVEAGGGFEASIAGDAFNWAAHLSAAGHDVTHWQDLAEDLLVERFEQAAAARGISLGGRRHGGRTNGIHLIHTDERGERSFQYHRAGSAAGETLTRPEDRDAIRDLSPDVVMFSGIGLAISSRPERLIENLAGLAPMVALCLNLRSGLHRREPDGCIRPVPDAEVVELLRRACPIADLICGSRDEFAALGIELENPPHRGDHHLVRDGCLVAASDGDAAAVLWHGDDPARAEPRENPQVIDTTGAGDAFAAGVVDAQLRQCNLEETVRAAVAWGSRAVTYRGALPAL